MKDIYANTYLVNTTINNKFDFDRETFQQNINYKNKFDNRLYYSMRYKRLPNFSVEQIFGKNVNVWSPAIGMVNKELITLSILVIIIGLKEIFYGLEVLHTGQINTEQKGFFVFFIIWRELRLLILVHVLL